MKPEILQKSTVVKIAPLIKADTELNVSQQQTVILMKMSPINKPPPPPSMTVKTFSIKKQIQSKCKLPSFNWTPLRPSQISGTIFNGFDDERIMKVVNFTHFEDKFQIGTAVSQCRKSTLANRFHKQPFETLLDPGRLRNVSILLRKLNFTADVVIEAIDDYNFNQLTLDSIELLNNLAPKDSETAAYKSFMNQKKDVVVLSREDKFLMRLSLIERLTRKLAIMSFMGNFDDRVDLLKIQLYNITTAALSLHTSKKLKNIFEIILAFGNYLNSNKSCGPAYGFKLKGTLERLNDTRSNDKKMSLLEYIILEIIANKFPQLLTLDSELFCIDESSRISLKNIQSEANEMTSGWEKVGEESLLTSNCTLVAFKISADEKFNKLMNELEMAKWNYNECATYFGEKSETIDSNEFFSIIQKFIYQFKGLALKVDATTKRTINEGNGNMSTLFP